MIQSEVFDYLFNKMRHREKRAVYENARYRRALLALACQNYFLGATFQNTSGAAAVTGVSQTLPLNRPLLIRGGGMNARTLGIESANQVDPEIGNVNAQLVRSGSNKAQISLLSLRSSALMSDGQGQPWEFDWLVPWRLEPNEIIQVRWTQATATPADTLYAVNFYGVAVDPNAQCDNGIIESICEQIRTTNQRPFYLNLKSPDSGGAIAFEAQAANQVAFTVTDKFPQHLLILGFRRNSSDYLPANTTLRIASGDGSSFSREELVIKGFEFYNTPDSGFFRFTVPHLLREGQSITGQLTCDTTNSRNQLEGEINLVCVTV